MISVTMAAITFQAASGRIYDKQRVSKKGGPGKQLTYRARAKTSMIPVCNTPKPTTHEYDPRRLTPCL